jgi:uncharacterized membrane protein YbhN (UPF0104 family)
VAGTLAFLTQILPLTPGGLGISEATFGQTANVLILSGGTAAYGTVMLAFRILAVLSVLPSIFFLPRTASNV